MPASGIALGIAGAVVLVLAAIGGNHFSKLNTNSNRSIAATVGGISNKSRENPAAELTLKPNPFELDSYAVSGRWNPLLETQPRVFSLAPWETARWYHDSHKQELSIDVPAPAYLQLGETDSTMFTLESSIASTFWQGHIGLFWGLKDAPVKPPAVGKLPQCHVVYLFVYQEKGQPAARIERDRALFNRNADGTLTLSSSTAICAQLIPFPTYRPARLELKIKGDVVEVYWNTQRMKDAERTSAVQRSPALSAAGGFGVYANRGTFQVSDPRIRLDGDVPRTK